MPLAKLFYLREAIRRRAHSARQAWARRRQHRRQASHFHLEFLESRLLLSATPTGTTVLEPATTQSVAPIETSLAAGTPAVVITATQVPTTVNSNSTVTFRLNYSTVSPVDINGTGGLGIRVHYD